MGEADRFEVMGKIGGYNYILVRGKVFFVIVAVVHKKSGMSVTLPISRKTGTKALREHEDMVAAVAAVPVRVLVNDMVHGLREKGTSFLHVIGQVGHEVACGKYGNVEVVCFGSIVGADGRIFKEVCYSVLR